MASLLMAIELNADIVEADVQLTKDGVPVIRHDKLLDRTTNTEGYTWNYTWEYYRKNILLKNGEPVCSLDEYCEIIAPHRQILYLDLKTFGAESVILETCLKHLPEDRFIIGSFDYKSIVHVKKLDPRVKTVLIVEGNPISVEEMLQNAKCDILALGFDSIDPEVVKKAQNLGKKVFTWTVNHPLEIERAKSMKVDGITSDYVDRI
jgi:glycerophosphoryl diester phosphodiesterase